MVPDPSKHPGLVLNPSKHAVYIYIYIHRVLRAFHKSKTGPIQKTKIGPRFFAYFPRFIVFFMLCFSNHR